jgi:dihydropyrimidinase
VITVADHRGMAGWTLYEGWPLRGRPWTTLLRGHVLLREGRLEQSPGSGRYLARGGPRPPLGGAVR